jgi:TM2 domain-containing membrane protein YozV
MKNKKVAGLFAIFFGTIGLHKFYLNEPNKALFRIILLFIFYYLHIRLGINILFFIGVIEGIRLLSMTDENFNKEYNNLTSFQKEQRPWGKQAPIDIPKSNPYKKAGIEKYREFDFPGAIEDFNNALVLDPNDIVTHFNLACSYSQIEDKDKALYHLKKSIQYGFNNYTKIDSNPGLAYLRTTPEYEEWKLNAQKNNPIESENTDENKLDLLVQIRILNEKREKGELDDDQYFEERKKLLG